MTHSTVHNIIFNIISMVTVPAVLSLDCCWVFSCRFSSPFIFCGYCVAVASLLHLYTLLTLPVRSVSPASQLNVFLLFFFHIIILS